MNSIEGYFKRCGEVHDDDEVVKRMKLNVCESEGEISCDGEKQTLGEFDGISDLLEEKWKKVLAGEFSKTYFKSLIKSLNREALKKKKIFPPKSQIMRCFELTPFDKVKVVILGQDPYHNDGQAEGLCFSVPLGQKKPSSLNNIYKELKKDMEANEGSENQFEIPSHGSLESWAKQGILLLNTCLTVEAHKANSHKDFGWQTFTDAVLSTLNREKEDVIFVLWGKQAEKKCQRIDRKKHHVLIAPHPSGLSAHRGFFGCNHFSKVNALLKKLGKSPISWRIPL